MRMMGMEGGRRRGLRSRLGEGCTLYVYVTYLGIVFFVCLWEVWGLLFCLGWSHIT